MDDDDQRLAMLIIDDYRKNGSCSLARIYDEYEDDKIRELISNLALLETLPSEFDENSLEGAIDKVKLEIKRKKMLDLQEKISKVSDVDPAQTAQVLKKKKTTKTSRKSSVPMARRSRLSKRQRSHPWVLRRNTTISKI